MNINNNTSMFASIRQALKEKKNSNNIGIKDILKLEAPAKGGSNVYVIRILPYIKEPSNTFFEYNSYSWTDTNTGKWVSEVSPTTFNERCPITEEKIKAKNSKNISEDIKNKLNDIKFKKQWLVNAYIIDDPVNPQNNGTVKIIRMGKQLFDKIYSAIDDENPENLGDNIYLKPENTEGYNFKIVVEQGPKFITYVKSDFSRKMTLIDELDSKEKIDEILNNTFDLTHVLPVKSYQELSEILNEFLSSNEVSNKEINTYIDDKLDDNVNVNNNEDEVFNDNSSYEQIIPEEPSQKDIKNIQEIDDDFIKSILK